MTKENLNSIFKSNESCINCSKRGNPDRCELFVNKPCVLYVNFLEQFIIKMCNQIDAASYLAKFL